MINIMYVDDHIHNLRLVEMMLKSKKCNVTGFSKAIDALKFLDKTPIDLIILDLTMPYIDGLTMIGEVRQKSAHSETPIIVLSARASTSDRFKAMEAGANAYLTKPFDRNKLKEMISELITVKKT